MGNEDITSSSNDLQSSSVGSGVINVDVHEKGKSIKWQLPPSKSHAIRALILAAQAENVTIISGVANCGNDVNSMKNCLIQLGVEIDYLDKQYDFGFIESISAPFCGSCTRARISSNGHFFTCLFSEKGHDILSMIRMGAENSDISQAIQKIWNNRNDKYSEQRKENTEPRIPVEMSYIGG